MKRRNFIGSAITAGAAIATRVSSCTEMASAKKTLNGNVNHSVCHWCYDLSVDELCAMAKSLGIASVELLGPEDWPTVAKHDLVCAMANPPGEVDDKLVRGFNTLAHHEWLVPEYLEQIPKVANAGYPNLICFSGNRLGLDDEEGLENCVVGLQKIVPAAERAGITICMELLNSRVDHTGHQCDRTEWGVELVKRVGSDNFKLLYDIYHMQIMEGDIIRTIRDNHSYIAHYHTAGNPGRNEIDDTQELNYKAIAQAIVDTGFKGFIAQEFIPINDPMESLRQAIEICDV